MGRLVPHPPRTLPASDVPEHENDTVSVPPAPLEERPSPAATRIPLRTAAAAEVDVIGFAEALGTVDSIEPGGISAKFRNHHGGQYRVAVLSSHWVIPDDLMPGDKVFVQFLRCSHPAAVDQGAAVLGTPNGERFFVDGGILA